MYISLISSVSLEDPNTKANPGKQSDPKNNWLEGEKEKVKDKKERERKRDKWLKGCIGIAQEPRSVIRVFIDLFTRPCFYQDIF